MGIILFNSNPQLLPEPPRNWLPMAKLSRWLPAQEYRLTACQQKQFIPCLLRIQFRQYFALYKLAREGDAFALRGQLKVEKNQE
ncbi:hypothetical protein ACMGGQ_10660 [Enterobacter sp. BNK-13]